MNGGGHGAIDGATGAEQARRPGTDSEPRPRAQRLGAWLLGTGIPLGALAGALLAWVHGLPDELSQDACTGALGYIVGTLASYAGIVLGSLALLLAAVLVASGALILARRARSPAP